MANITQDSSPYWCCSALAAVNLVRNAFPGHPVVSYALSNTILLQGLLLTSDVYYDINEMMFVSVYFVILHRHCISYDIRCHPSGSGFYLVNGRIPIRCSDIMLQPAYSMPV